MLTQPAEAARGGPSDCKVVVGIRKDRKGMH